MCGGRAVAVLLFGSLLNLLAVAQQNCPLPPSIQPVPHGTNIFSDQQEIDLGDALAESLAREVRIIHDDTLDAYLRSLGGRIAQHLPPNQLKFRFYLIELPEVNAFSIAGGRVYISRKIVALTRTEDELAGVIAHELGHSVTHQSAIEVTARLRELLKVTQVHDRADVFEKVHLLMENAARKPAHAHGGEEQQYVADQVALYAMARAGYAPHAYVDLWDRFQQTHGKTGSWLSDLFGSTKPSERRLREMLKNFSALPPGCADIAPASRTTEFAKWQTEVINYSGLGGEESVPGLVLKQVLARPLRPDVSHLRFSPDGKYVLAQDEGGIHVLTREPFAIVFYIPAANANNAAFSPDSHSIVFHNHALRVESWSVTEQRRNWVRELTVLHPCVQSELSPNGSMLACLNTELELSLIDVASGSILVSRKRFVEATAVGYCMMELSLAEGEPLRLIEMKFSPDGEYFLAGGNGTHFAWQVTSRREFSLPGSIKEIMRARFAFVGSGKILGLGTSSAAKSPVLRFPSGERLAQVSLRYGLTLREATRGDYIFAGPVKDGAMGLLDVNTSRVPIIFKTPAADIYDETFITERTSGEVALNALGKAENIAVVKLPQARLGPLRAAAISTDFNWLLLSNRTRGAAWDLARNIRTMELRSFQGAWFSPDGAAYVDFPKFMESEREIVRLNPELGVARKGYMVGDVSARQHGPYLLVTTPRRGKSPAEGDLSTEFLCLRMIVSRSAPLGKMVASNQDWEIRDVRDGHVVWSHYFAHEVPAWSLGSGQLLLRWDAAESAARDELNKFPALKGKVDKDDYLLELLDLHNDAPVSELVIKTNKASFLVNYTLTDGDWVIASASDNQVLTYSWKSGQQKGHFFGSYPVASHNGLLAVESEAGQLSVYDLASSQLKQQYRFADPISIKAFSADGKRMFVMTASQTAYVIDLTSGS